MSESPSIARRTLLQTAVLAPIAAGSAARAGGLQPLAADLLRDWCDGLLRLQIDEPARPERHGAFRCPAC